MPIELLLAPVGAGKTHAALYRLIQQKHAAPFSKVWVLLASNRQEDAFRQRLIDWDAGNSVYMNVEFFNFYALYARLLHSVRKPPRRLHDVARRDTGRYSLLRALAEQLREEERLAVFAPIAHTAGFITLAADFIYELKQNLVSPEEFADVANALKDTDLAALYGRYQEKLREENVVDRDGEGWLALAVAREPQNVALGCDVDLLIVDGYDQFTPLQADIIALLAGRAEHTLITLTDFPQREDGSEDDRQATVGRRFGQAQDRLRYAFRQAGLLSTIQISRLADEGGGKRPPSLQSLIASIFSPSSLRNDRQPHASGDALALIEAPSPEEEVAAVLRRVKHLLLAESVQPDDILIALRDWSRYRPHFSRYQREYGLPLALHHGEPLGENPAIIALMTALDLPGQDFPRAALLETLRSPYFQVPGLTPEDIEKLESISSRLLVTGGFAAWREALDLAQNIPLSERDEIDDVLIGQAQPLIDPETAERLRYALLSFFDAVTPPMEDEVADYVHWLDVLIGKDEDTDPDDNMPQVPIRLEDYTLRVVVCAKRQPSKRGIVERDIAALSEFKRLLRALLSAQELLRTLGEEPRVPYSVFYSDLKAAVETTPINALPSRTGSILVTTSSDARGLPHPHVFILGLSEGVFPAQVPEDPLYLDSERRTLGESLDSDYGRVLETAADKSGDDGVFFELISLARQSLTLSRPTVQNGAPWPASHLWRAVLTAQPSTHIQRYVVGAVIPAHEVASIGEALLAATTQTDGDAKLRAWLVASAPMLWTHVRAARRVERGRMSRTAPMDRYTGRLADRTMIDYAAEALGDGRVWSASQLNDYGQCPFRFYSKHLLKLKALEEPQVGMDVMQLGTLNHEILERTYRLIAQQDLLIVPENAAAALAILEEAANLLLPTAPERLGFRASGLWAQEQAVLKRRLAALVRDDFEDSPLDGEFKGDLRKPYRFEQGFGFDEETRIDLGSGLKPIRVRGVIDRIDLQGEKAIIVDYKMGTEIKTQDAAAGRNFQMMVYLLVAEQALDFEARGGAFWRINARKLSGAMHRDDPDDEDTLALARAQVAENIRAGRGGDFAVQPNTETGRGPCAKYCEFHQFCRHSITGRRDVRNH